MNLLNDEAGSDAGWVCWTSVNRRSEKGFIMRLLITGAGGTLGTALAPALTEAGHEPVLFDVQPLQTPYESVQGDVRKAEDVRAAARGAEFIVHTAAIHGIHLRDHTPQDFYELNLTGTFNVWEAAVEVGARGLVFSSTMGVYKSHNAPGQGRGMALHEDLPPMPGDIYGFTKVAGEEMCLSCLLLPSAIVAPHSQPFTLLVDTRNAGRRERGRQ